ncbi:MAG: ABC transporter ATP-binding protein/permease [Ruminococcaceae bacterium]|nr:ABC transporter ATP-binding protein/permease [Oscillospiraceae bacterium]
MLELKNIFKTYKTGDTTVSALDGVSLCFRENEFVSILGPSGCGKTTMLNIVGGLDRYDAGDLIINGKSTRFFRDGDWDTYRNHSIGFVFQSYNLIPHQTVLANVELALTLSGVSKSERRARAVEALRKVGLGDQLHKKPNQMSGGQMQRVAIARALVNNPDILLADEPTGALDTQTSVQIMELLKEVASDRLVIMVTHNPELAEHYSTRIVKLSDGRVTDDSDPISEEEYAELAQKDSERRIQIKKDKKALKAEQKKTSMSFATAISLSMKNLMTKKGRTILTSFAGSIGIIGIALILSLSNGIQLFIDQVQEDTLSTYPLSIYKQTQDMSAMMSAMTATADDSETHEDDKIYVDNSLDSMVSAMTSTRPNNLDAFKVYLDENYDDIKEYVSDIQYTYDFDLQVYTADGKLKIGLEEMFNNMGDSFSSFGSLMEASGSSMINVFSEMIDNQELLDQQYELVEGDWPKSENEVVLVVSRNNSLSKMALYMLGVLDQSELEGIMDSLVAGEKYESEDIEPFPIDYFLNMKFNLLNTEDFFIDSGKTYTENGKTYPVWQDVRTYYTEEQLAKFVKENSSELKISGIIRPRPDVSATSISGVIGYTHGLTDAILEMNTESKVITQQIETPNVNVTTGLPFERTKYTPDTIGELINKIDDSMMDQFYAYMTQMIKTDEQFASQLDIKDANSFGNVFFLLPAENRAEVVGAMLEAAKAKAAADPMAAISLNALCTSIGQMMTPAEAFNVSPDTLIALLPMMDMQSLYVLVNGLDTVNPMTQEPMKIDGLIALAGEETMSGIYTNVSAALKEMTVTEEIFLAILHGFPADSEEFIQLEEALYNFAPQTDATYDSTLKTLGNAVKESPASINFYAKDFHSKENVEQFIANYNASVEEKDTLEYTDIIGIMMSSVSIIIDVISYVLIAFVSISLVVSSIMIGIITNISVLERTKEIGILRAIGASKKDISRVFNAETFIIGVAAGIIGIVFTILFCFPVNLIIQTLSGFSNIKAVLPWVGALVLVIISMLLTIFAGLIPAKKASNKDPVIALRTE